MKEVIRLENVVTVSSRVHLNDVSLSVLKGEKIEIYGQPDSGKETLIKLITGMEYPSTGKVYVHGKAVHQMRADTAAVMRGKFFGIVRQDPHFISNLTTWENIALPLMIQSVPRAKRKKAALELLNQFHLDYVAHVYPKQLSIFEMQMAAMARAFVTKPKILLFDEITAHFSKKEAGHLLETLSSLSAFNEATVIYFTTIKNSASFATRHFVLYDGMIWEE
ncbi:ABC transporter ATP-binding protein [Bacillus niameyensis]|uniref:ABC transporter ATP-binding protein n=1 Tax=Bacillus niameyensis TaxID=1522308 RepID=UPI0007851DEC|nr:ATP-binding cassette domain-containing protein [Bacillus niameyensis]